MSATPNTYPVATIAKLLQLTPRRVQQLTAEGVIPKAARGQYELAPTVQAYIGYLQDRAAGNNSQVSSLDYHREKARKVKAEADIAEIEAAKLRREVIEVREARQAWTIIITEIRANLLNNVPARSAAAILGLESETEIKAAIRREIAQAMQAASEADVEEMFSDGQSVQSDHS